MDSAHDHVIFARTLLRKLGAGNQQAREEMLQRLGFVDADSLNPMRRREELVFDDFRVIDMYEAAIRHDLRVYQDRKGNWVQKFAEPDDVKLFATAQFSRYREVERFLNEQLADKAEVQTRATGGTSP